MENTESYIFDNLTVKEIKRHLKYYKNNIEYLEPSYIIELIDDVVNNNDYNKKLYNKFKK